MLDRWINQHMETQIVIPDADAPESLIPLYVQIAGSLKSMYFNRLKSHLMTAHKESDDKTKAYKEAYDIITDIEENEPKHNAKVANFMNELQQKIKNTIYSTENCNIQNMVEHEFASNIKPSFMMKYIIDYYIAKLDRSDEVLEIRQLDASTYQLFRPFDMIEMGRGDEEAMKCLKTKLEILEKDILNTLGELRDEANRLIDQFNTNLTSKATDLIVQINDGYFHGKCEYESNLKFI